MLLAISLQCDMMFTLYRRLLIYKCTYIYICTRTSTGYAVVIPRPNTNSYMEGTVKKYISGSETPEAHVLFVWDNIICMADNIERAVLLGYGGGASLCKDILQRHLASPAKANVVAILTMNASLFFENDDTIMTKDVLGKISANLECASPKLGCRLYYRKIKLGCETFSVGLPPGFDVSTSVINGISLCSFDAIYL